MAASGDLGAMYYEIEARVDKAKRNVDDLEKYNLAAIDRIRKAWDNVSRVGGSGGSGGGPAPSSQQQSSSGVNASAGGSTNWTMASVNRVQQAAESAAKTVADAHAATAQAQANAIRDASNQVIQQIKTGVLHPALRGKKNELALNLARSSPAMAQQIAGQWGTTVDDLFNYVPPATRARIAARQYRQSYESRMSQIDLHGLLVNSRGDAVTQERLREQQRVMDEAVAARNTRMSQADLGSLLGNTRSSAQTAYMLREQQRVMNEAVAARNIRMSQMDMMGQLNSARAAGQSASVQAAQNALANNLMEQANGPRLTPLQMADIQHEANQAHASRPLTEAEVRGAQARNLGPRSNQQTAADRRQARALGVFSALYAADMIAGGVNSIMDYNAANRMAGSLPTSQQRQLAEAQAQQRAYQSNPMNSIGNAIRGVFGLETDQDREVAIVEAQRAEERRIAARDFNFGRSSLNRATRFGVASANAAEDAVVRQRLSIQQQYEESTSAESMNKISEQAIQAGLDPREAINEAKANAAKMRDANNRALDRQVYYANRDNTNSAAISNTLEQQRYREAKVLELRSKHVQELTTTPISQIATKQREQAAQMDELNATLAREKQIIDRGLNAEARAAELRVNHAGRLAQRVELEAKLQTDYQQADAADKQMVLIRNQRMMAAFNAQWKEEEGVSLMMGGSRIRQLGLQSEGRNFAAQREAVEAERQRRLRVELPNAADPKAVRQQIEDEASAQNSVIARQERLSRQDVMYGTRSLERHNRVWDATSYPDRAMRERSASIRDRLDQYEMQIERNPEMADVLKGQRDEFVRGQLLSLTRSAPEGRVMNPLSVIGSPTGGAERQGLIQDLAKAYTGDNKEIIRLLTKIAEKGGGQAVRRSTP